MAKQDIFKMYDPANSGAWSDEAIAGLANLTKEEVNQLAKKYPNKPNFEAYLILKNTSVKDAKDQLYPRSTWQNFAALLRMGKTNFVAYTSKKLFNKTKADQNKIAPVQDLTEDQVKQELSAASKRTNTGLTKAASPKGEGSAAVEDEHRDFGDAGKTAEKASSNGSQAATEEFPELTVPGDKAGKKTAAKATAKKTAAKTAGKKSAPKKAAGKK